MDLNKIGKLIYKLRKDKNMTQKQIAERLGVLPKTVSKWETGNGFPDVSTLSALSEILGVSEKILLSGSLIENTEDSGNMKKTKFYVCPYCASFVQGAGEANITCCGRTVEPLTAKPADDFHAVTVTEIENDFYIEINHEMTKEHFISYISYVGFDRVLTVRLYPEQNCEVRIPRMFRGKLYFYCNKHGFFEYNLKRK